ncbi:MAG: MMPL family transporter, partial [Planctomycetota bacterium]
RSIRIGLVSVLPNVLPLLAIVATLAVTNTPMQVSAALALCLAIGVATDDTVHFITRFQQSCSGGANAARACLVSYRTVGRTLLLTTVVLACGFATMIWSPSPAIYLFSTLTCVSLIVALIGDLLFLPALLVLLNPPATKRSFIRFAVDVRSARPHLAGTV